MTAEISVQAQPLSGIRILELSQFMTASLATMMLAEQGAEVLKVEPPKTGDRMRYAGTRSNGISALWANCNRGKRSAAIDIRAPRGQAIVRKAARDADVVIHNFRPGVLERLSLDSATLRAENPGLIYVSITGFGPEGPLVHAPAFDHIVQALSGMAAVQGDAERPALIRTAICDKVTAYTACQAVTAALFARARTGKGQHVEVPMLDACLYFLWSDGMMNHTFVGGDVQLAPTIKGTYRAFAAKDGYFAMVAGTDEQWNGIFRFIGRTRLGEDPRFASHAVRSVNYEALFAAVADGFVDIPLSDVLEHLTGIDVPCAPCLDLDDVIIHPQVAARGLIEDHAHPALGRLRSARFPIAYEGIPRPQPRECPLIGEHSRETLGQWGFGDEEIAALVEDGIVQC